MSLDLERWDDHDGGAGGSDGPGPNRAVRTAGVALFIVALFVMSYAGVKWLASSVRDVITTETTVVVAGLPVTLEVAPGESASQIARLLAEAGVVASATDFDRVVREARASNRLQAGTYELETGMSPEAVLAVLLEGPAGTEVYRLTVIEGLTIGQTLESIERQSPHSFDELSALLLDGTVTSNLLTAPAETLRDWEGLLFPDTYEFAEDASAEEILALLAATAEERVGAVDWTFLEERGLTPYDGLIIASLIEREVAVEDDRPLVASVIFNRLDVGMRLQFDATVVYALGALPEGGLSFQDLEIDSPYNTYRIDGLPPTPISGVRVSSLRAAAEPAESAFLFFVTTDASGAMTFAETFEEFQAILDSLPDEG